MNKDNQPLLFIQSASTKLNCETQQNVFDSRYKKDKKIVDIICISEELLSKIDSIISLYEKNHPVVCEIITDESIEGIPFLRNNNVLQVKSNGNNVSVDINMIKDLFIISI